MKTVSGVVLSSKPVSLSKAARVLSKFVASDNGASPAFAAYLRRASASFDELVQLRKEIKGSGGDHGGKKKHIPDGVITEETVNSVKKHGQDGNFTEGKVGVSDMKKHKRDEVEVRDIEGDGSVGIRTDKRSSGANVSGHVAVVDAVDANGHQDDIECKDFKKKKKKKKRETGERDESDSAVKKEEQGVDGNAGAVVENGVSERKKYKKSKKVKEEKESSSIGDADQIDSNEGSEHRRVKTEGNDRKKKKRSHEDKENESTIKIGCEEVDEKESRKRKHKGSDDGQLDDSEEQHRSKKKSRK